MRTPVVKRSATTEERRASVDLAKELRRVTYPDRAKTKIRSEVPPGRMNMREAMRKDVQRLNRETPTARPFVRIERAKAIHTPITAGIMCDISGSMSGAQEKLAVARWVLTDALHQVHGTVATVLFGAEAHGIQAPHERQRNVQIYEAYDGYEDYIDGFHMLDGALNLIDGHGARLLVCITDGHFNLQTAVEYAEVTMDMCRRSGVAVIWVDISGYFARPDTYGFGTLLNAGHMSSVQFAKELGRAVVEEFRRNSIQASRLLAA